MNLFGMTAWVVFIAIVSVLTMRTIQTRVSNAKKAKQHRVFRELEVDGGLLLSRDSSEEGWRQFRIRVYDALNEELIDRAQAHALAGFEREFSARKAGELNAKLDFLRIQRAGPPVGDFYWLDELMDRRDTRAWLGLEDIRREDFDLYSWLRKRYIELLVEEIGSRLGSGGKDNFYEALTIRDIFLTTSGIDVSDFDKAMGDQRDEWNRAVFIHCKNPYPEALIGLDEMMSQGRIDDLWKSACSGGAVSSRMLHYLSRIDHEDMIDYLLEVGRGALSVVAEEIDDESELGCPCADDMLCRCEQAERYQD